MREIKRVRNLRVLVTGAFATGKSTLCDRVVKRLHAGGVKVAYVGGVARLCPLPLNRRQTIATSAWLTMRQMEHEFRADAAAPDIVLVDRSLPDILSHTWAVRLRQSEGIVASALQTLCAEWCQRYALIFVALLDPLREIEKDSVRVSSKAYQARLEGCILRVVERLSIPHIRLPAEDAAREAMVLNMIAALRPSGLGVGVRSDVTQRRRRLGRE